MSDFFSFTIWETQGLSDKLLSKNHWDLEASQTFLDRSLLKIFLLTSLKKMTSYTFGLTFWDSQTIFVL